MDGNNESTQNTSQGNLMNPEISTDATGTTSRPPPGFEFIVQPSTMFSGQWPEDGQHGHGSLAMDWTLDHVVNNYKPNPRPSSEAEVLQKEETADYQLPNDLEKIWEQNANQVLNDLENLTLSSISSTSLSPDPLDQTPMEGVDEVDAKETTWDELSMAVSLVMAQNNEKEQSRRKVVNNKSIAQPYRGKRGRGFGRTENSYRGRNNNGGGSASPQRRHSTHSMSDAVVRTSTPLPFPAPRFSSIMPGEYFGNGIQSQNSGTSSRYNGNTGNSYRDLEFYFGTRSRPISPILYEPVFRWEVLQPIPRGIREMGQVARRRESFGFILSLCREVEIFFHFTEYRGDFSRLRTGDLVDYAYGIDRKTGKHVATDVKNVGWELDLTLASFRTSDHFYSLDKTTQETFEQVAANFTLIKLLLHDKLESFYRDT